VVVFQLWIDLITKVQNTDEAKLIDTLIEKTVILNENDRLEYLINFFHNIKPDDMDTDQILKLMQVIYQKTVKNQRFIEVLSKEICEFEENSEYVQSIIESCLSAIEHE
jgi:hypothetical protein